MTYMMATEAHHTLGDISRDEPSLALIEREDEENYYGEWVVGFGFVNVRFPKATTRPLTAEEYDWHHGAWLMVGSSLVGPLDLGERTYS